MSYVLVHGGATTGRFWDRVVGHLDAPALAVDLPGRLDRPGDLGTLTVGEAAASVVRDVEAWTRGDGAAGNGRRGEGGGSEPLVLVAHSSGGLEVPGIVAGLGPGRVRAIVLNAASVPPEGGNGFDCMQPRHRGPALQYLADADAAGTTITTPVPRPESMRSSSGEELSDEDLAFACDPVRSVADAFNLYRQPVHWSATAGIPVTYIVNRRDRAVPADLQREMAGRLPEPPTVVELDAGHLPAITRPAELAALITAAAGG